jgi:hypothetical protein
MTFAEGVLRLVRPGRAIEPDREASDTPARTLPTVVDAAAVEIERGTAADGGMEAFDGSRVDPSTGFDPLREPGFADLEAAVALVDAGLASRVVVAGFPSWPGLLWRAYRLAEEANVLILPTVVHSGGRVDIVVTREKPIE